MNDANTVVFLGLCLVFGLAVYIGVGLLSRRSY